MVASNNLGFGLRYVAVQEQPWTCLAAHVDSAVVLSNWHVYSKVFLVPETQEYMV